MHEEDYESVATVIYPLYEEDYESDVTVIYSLSEEDYDIEMKVPTDPNGVTTKELLSSQG